MQRLSLKAKAKVATILVATTSVLSLGSTGMMTRPAGADPAGASALNAVGSDTIQDVMDALAGADPYPPSTASNYQVALHSDSASLSKTINSWDAIPAGGTGAAPGGITTTYGGATFDRPNGSGNGIVALSHAADVAANNFWWAGEPTVGGGALNNPATSFTGVTTTGKGVNVSGQINFARSSKGPKNTNLGQLTYIPFGRDAVSFAYFTNGGQLSSISTLSTAQLTSLYTTGTITVADSNPAAPGGVDTIHACITQQGSGTTKFWEGAISVTDGTAQAASAASGCTANPSTLEENGGNSFYAYASTLPAFHGAVVDFSAGSWISQANPNTALDRSATARTNGVDLGAIDALGKPYTVSGGLESPSPGFYASTQYGRNVNVVVPTVKIGTSFRKDPALISLFVGPSSKICTDGNSTIDKFGFLSISNCGATTVVGNFYDTPNGTPTG